MPDWRPTLTGSAHILPFDRLSPRDFERLCLWLIKSEDFTNTEHLGEAGGDTGRDIVAEKGGQRYIFQCKRVERFSFGDANTEIRKILSLHPSLQPHVFVFIVSRSVPAKVRDAIRRVLPEGIGCAFWTGSELDAMVKCHPEIVGEFFQANVHTGTSDAPVFVVPFHEPDLLARESILTELAGVAASTDLTIRMPSLSGPGGVGKTQLAVKYAYRYASLYPSGIFWVDASGSAESVVRQLASHALSASLPRPHTNHNESNEELAHLWLTHVGSRKDALLILDDLRTDEVLTRDLPGIAGRRVSALKATLLITTRRRQLPGCTSIQIGPLSPSDALALLVRELGDRLTDESSLREIVGLVGESPLAIKVVGAHMRRQRSVPAPVIIESLRVPNPQRTSVDRTLVVDDYQQPLDLRLFALFRTALLDLPKDLPAIQTILLALGALPQPRFPVVLLFAALPASPPFSFPDDVRDALNELADLHLIHLLDEVIALHPLFHAFLAYQSTGRSKALLANRLITTLLHPKFLAKVRSEEFLALLSSSTVFDELSLTQKRLEEISAFRTLLDASAAELRLGYEPLSVLYSRSQRRRDASLAATFDDAASYKKIPWMRFQWSTVTEDWAELRSIIGHPQGATSCGMSLDGTHILSASLDGSLRLWDGGTAKQLLQLHCSESALLTCALASTGMMAICGGVDRMLHIAELVSGRRIASLVHGHSVISCALSRDCTVAVSVSLDEFVHIWHIPTSTRLHCLPLPDVRRCALSSDGRWAVAAARHQIVVWDTETGLVKNTIDFEEAALPSDISISQDGRIASGWLNGMIHVCHIDGTNSRLLQRPFFRRPLCAVECCAISADGMIVVAGLVDRSIGVWSVESSALVAVMSGHSVPARSLGTSQDGSVVVSGAFDGILKIWDVRRARKIDSFPPPNPDGVVACAISGDGRTGFVTDYGLRGTVWALNEAEQVLEVPPQPDGRCDFKCMDLSGDGRTLVTGARFGQNGFAKVLVSAIKDAAGGDRFIIRDATFKDDGPPFIHVWDLPTGGVRASASGHENWLEDASLSFDGTALLTASGDETLRLWRTSTMECISIMLPPTPQSLRACALSEDGTFAVSVYSDGALALWAPKEGRLQRLLQTVNGRVTACSKLNKNKLLAIGTETGRIEVIDASTGATVLAAQDAGAILDCKLSFASDILLSLSADNVLTLRSLKSATPFLRHFVEGLQCADIDHNGRYIIIGEKAGGISVLTVIRDHTQDHFLYRVKRLVSRRILDLFESLTMSLLTFQADFRKILRLIGR
jgi:WD40 repeat protein